jgi:GDPmannose 4,6-dehydratase
VREFAELAFGRVGLDWEKYVRIDRAYLRPAEVDTLLGDSSKARESLGWKPTVSFPQLVALMVEADLKAEGVDAEKAMKRASVSR